MATFAQGHLLSSEVLPVGGNHATFDLAQTFSAPVYEAERIKKDHVTLARAAGDDQEAIAYVPADEEAGAASSATKGQARAVVRDRMLRLFADIAGRLERANTARFAKRIVLTGGASQQAGLSELAADFFARPVRIARIQPMTGLPAEFSGPAFSTGAGLVQVALDPAAGAQWEQSGQVANGYLQRMGQWLRESF
jgi:cell division protein FtsA